MYQRLVTLLLAFAISAGAADTSKTYTVHYSNGSFRMIKPGRELHITLTETAIKLSEGSTEFLSLPVASITDLTEGVETARRPNPGVAAATLGWSAALAKKTPRRSVGFTWAEGMIDLEVRPVEARPIILELQRITGKEAATVNAVGRP